MSLTAPRLPQAYPPEAAAVDAPPPSDPNLMSARPLSPVPLPAATHFLNLTVTFGPPLHGNPGVNRAFLSNTTMPPPSAALLRQPMLFGYLTPSGVAYPFVSAPPAAAAVHAVAAGSVLTKSKKGAYGAPTAADDACAPLHVFPYVRLRVALRAAAVVRVQSFRWVQCWMCVVPLPPPPSSADASSAQLFVINHDYGEHPFHIHGARPPPRARRRPLTPPLPAGHQVWLVASSLLPQAAGYADAGGCLIRDTVTLPSARFVYPDGSDASSSDAAGAELRPGWLRLRYLADNPGVWFLHCHIEFHMAAGLSAVLIEAPDALQAAAAEGSLLLPPTAQETCDRFKLVLDAALVANWGTGKSAADPGRR